jgi:hypothetical protein
MYNIFLDICVYCGRVKREVVWEYLWWTGGKTIGIFGGGTPKMEVVCAIEAFILKLLGSVKQF